MHLPNAGELFDGRYRLQRELGVGGFALVFLALDETTGRTVALKVLRPERGAYDQATRHRFAREVSIIAQLRNPHCVTLYTYGTSAEGLLYMVFEYVAGEDLSERLARQGTLSAPDVRALLQQLLGALREAHDAGLIHRDIKPQNVRVASPPGQPLQVKLLDFGIARSTDHGSPSVTKTGELLGTPRYMSPEQLRGQPLGPTSDLYSLGMVAFELLAGEQALAPNVIGAQLERLSTEHVLGGDMIGRVDPELLRIIQRMTAMEPRDRFPSAAAVLSGLAPNMYAASVSREVSIVEEPPSKWTYRAGALIAALVAGSVVWMFLIKTDPPRPAPEPQPQLSEESPLLSTASSNEQSPPSPDLASSHDAGPIPDDPIEGGSPGCGTVDPPSQFGDYLIPYAPSDYDPRTPYPAVVWLMADHDPHQRIPQTERFQRFVEEQDVIVLVPIGSMSNRWRPQQAGRVTRGVRQALDNLCLRPDQVFIMSTGGSGMLATHLSCEPWVAAIAISSFLGPAEALELCSPTLWITPNDSQHLPIEGGDTCMKKVPFLGASAEPAEAYSKIKARMRDLHTCRGRAKERTFGDTTCETWNCKVPFESCVTGGGIGWPGTPQSNIASAASLGGCAEPAPSPFDATAHAWAFFLRVSPTPGSD